MSRQTLLRVLGIPHGGGAPLWNPLDDAALAGWWAGDAGTWQDTGGTTPATAEGQTVDRWSDLSGNNRHLLDGTHTAGPTLAAAYRAGKNCLSFVAASNSMLGATFARTYPCTLYMALYIPAGTVADVRFLANSRGDPSRASIYIPTNTTNIAAANNSVITISSVTLDAWLYFAAVFNGASSSLTLNNTTTVTGNTGTETQEGLVLAGNPYFFKFGTGGGARTTMVVGEIILIQSAHDANQQTRAYEYLQSRWEA